MKLDPTQEFTSVSEAVTALSHLPRPDRLAALAEIVTHNLRVGAFGFASELAAEGESVYLSNELRYEVTVKQTEIKELTLVVYAANETLAEEMALERCEYSDIFDGESVDDVVYDVVEVEISE